MTEYFIYRFINKILYYQLLILFIFFLSSCQKKDPLTILPNSTNFISYQKINKIDSNSTFGFNSLFGKTIDSLSVFSEVIPDLINQTNIEIYYSNFKNNLFLLVIKSDDFGKILRDKISIEKDIRNFDYKEIFSEKSSFLSPLESDIIICSNSLDEIKSAIKRTEKNSLISNTEFKNIYNKFKKSDIFWSLVTDTIKMKMILLPIHRNISESFFYRYIYLFSSVTFQKNNDDKLTLEIMSKSLEPQLIDLLLKQFEIEKSTVNLYEIRKDYPNFTFNKINIQNLNQKLLIIFE